MSKVAVVYWSGTGNTEAMAMAVAEGAKNAGADTEIFTAAEFQASMAAGYDAIAFGCPAMGDEVLEEDEFEPMFQACTAQLKNKKIAIFGSYGWGDGEWMRRWEEDCRSLDLNLVADGLICNEMPDEDGLEQCRSLGAQLSK